MRTILRILILVAVAVILPGAAWAQVALAGTVKDAAGLILPGVTVEASSPALIEKTRAATTDSNGQYRIESLQPGTYSVTFTLAGFSVLRRDDLVLSGTGVVRIDADMKLGGVTETVTVTGETPVVDVTSTRREITLDNETMRSIPGPRSYSQLLTMVPGLQTNLNNASTGPVFAIFPIHGGRGVESRLTVDGLNISNPPGGNQPPNYTADTGNAQEVTMTTSGGLGEAETAGLVMNIVPKQGGNTLTGLFYVSGFSEGMQSNNFTDELKARGATQPTPLNRVYDFNAAVGGPIVKDRLWYYMSVRVQGQRQSTQNVYYNQNAGNPNAYTYVPDLSKLAFSDRLWENYTPRITWQATPRNKFSFSWDVQPVCRTCTGTTSLTGSPNFIFPTSPEADGHGEFSPQSVQTARWTSTVTRKLLLEAGMGTTYYQWGGRELDPNPGSDLAQVVNINQIIVPGVVTNMRYRSQNPLNNRTRGSNWIATAAYVTGSHAVKIGYQGSYWRDDREMLTNTQNLGYTFFGGAPSSITQYAAPYQVNARAMQTTLYAQDQWTINRLSVQGALRWDRPWSWFPEQVQPATRFFPGATFPKTDGVTGYNDITPRLGAAYDLFGNGKTALKVSLGKYLQGASVSNLAYGANPSQRIPGAVPGAIFPPNVTRTWGDLNGNFIPDCNLTNPLAQTPATTGSVDNCGQISDLRFGSAQLIGAQFDPEGFSGWGVRPSDWAFGVSVQQELFPRAAVEVAYHHRSLTMFTTLGTVTDNLAVSPNDLGAWTLTAPRDPRLPGGGGFPVGPLYNVNTNVFGQVNNFITPTNKVADDTRVFNGVDVTFNLRNFSGVTFSGGTSTGKVTNDWCAIRDAVPENAAAMAATAGSGYLLNPFCLQESPWETSFRAAVTYTIPRIDLLVSTVYFDKTNIGTDQLVSLQANYTLTAADLADAAAQIGRPLNVTGPLTVNILAPGELYGPRVRQWNFGAKKVVRIGSQRLTLGADIYNLLNNNVTTAFNPTFVPNVAGWQSPQSYMNPRVFRLNAEFAW